jgi:prepilin-type N-terminal cleavage/methylation domain-containing protein
VKVQDAAVQRKSQAGFTLVELMISLVIFSFAIAGVLSVAVSMTQGFRDQRAAVDAEAAARVPLDFMVDAIRQASPGAPTGNIFDLTTCSTTALAVTDNFSGNGWDQLDMVFASGAVVTSTRAIWADQPADLASVVVNDASQLSVGDYVVISNLSQGHLAAITAITGSTLTLAVTGCATPAYPAGGYPSGSLVIRALHAQFTIGTENNVPTLMMTSVDTGVTEPIAQGIEDLQLALGVDPGNNAADALTELGVTANDDDWVGNVSGDAAIAGTLRAVRVTLIARTATGYIGLATPFNRPAAEDHAASATFDTYRRRVLRAMVEVRNFGESP